MSRRPAPSELDQIGTELVRQTALIAWQELAHHHAAGNLLGVVERLDLIDIGRALRADRNDLLAVWLADGSVYPIDDQRAIAWQRDNSRFWALVIAPFVLIQKATHKP